MSNSPQQIEKKITREEMANAVVKKAIKNGYSWMVDFKHLRFNDEDYWRYKNGREIFACLEEVLFEHKFAKAFCKVGNSYLIKDWKGRTRQRYWKANSWRRTLSQAVLSDDPLTYYFERL